MAEEKKKNDDGVNVNYYLFFDKDKLPALQEAVRVSIAIILAVAAARIFNLEKPQWCVMAVPVLYVGTTQGLALKRSYHRCLGTVVALPLAWLLFGVGCLSLPPLTYSLMAFMWFISFYVYYLTDSYIFAITVRSCYSFMSSAILIGQGQFLDLYSLTFSRIINNVICASIVVLCELLIFPGATKSGRNLVTISRGIAEKTAGVLGAVVDSFYTGERLPTDKRYITGILADRGSLDKIYKSLEYEFNSLEGSEVYASYRTTVEKFLEQIMALACYTRLTEPGRNEDREVVRKAGSELALGLEKIFEPDYPGGMSSQLQNTLDRYGYQSDGSAGVYPTLFIHRLRRLAEIADELHKLARLINNRDGRASLRDS